MLHWVKVTAIFMLEGVIVSYLYYLATYTFLYREPDLKKTKLNAFLSLQEKENYTS